jgi:hypothetical protein
MCTSAFAECKITQETVTCFEVQKPSTVYCPTHQYGLDLIVRAMQAGESVIIPINTVGKPVILSRDTVVEKITPYNNKVSVMVVNGQLFYTSSNNVKCN